MTVKPLVPAEQMALPTLGATFDLAAWLPAEEKAEFLEPLRIKRYGVASGDPPAPRSWVHRKDWPGALKRFDESRVLTLTRVADIPRDVYGRVPSDGGFGIDKDDDWEKVICARVPSNSLETPLEIGR